MFESIYRVISCEMYFSQVTGRRNKADSPVSQLPVNRLYPDRIVATMIEDILDGISLIIAVALYDINLRELSITRRYHLFSHLRTIDR